MPKKILIICKDQSGSADASLGKLLKYHTVLVWAWNPHWTQWIYLVSAGDKKKKKNGVFRNKLCLDQYTEDKICNEVECECGYHLVITTSMKFFIFALLRKKCIP